MVNVESKAREIRKAMVTMCIGAGKGHVTSSLSCVDILVALYYGIMKYDSKNPNWEERDRLIVSKGQASPALYSVLADVGFFSKKELDNFLQKGSRLGVHLNKDVPGVELSVGSLGQGFGVAAGMALAAKMNMERHTTYCVLGDGECYEGSIWETAMFAAHNRLNNLVPIIDRNYMCVMDFTENLLALDSLEEKWDSFGFRSIRVDGHSIKHLQDVLLFLKNKPYAKPTVIIADTVKGKGVDSLSYDPVWHGVTPRGNVALDILKELGVDNVST